MYKKTALQLNNKFFIYLIFILLPFFALYLGSKIASGSGANYLYLGIFCALYFWIYKNPIVAIFLVLISDELLWAAFSVRPHVQLASFTIYLNDILAAIFAIIFLYKLFNKKVSLSKYYIFFFLFSAIILLNVIRGYLLYDQTAIVHARGYIITLPTIALISSYKYTEKNMRQIINIFIFISIVLIAITILRTLNIIDTFQSKDVVSSWRSDRALSRNGGFFLAITLIGLLISINNIPRKKLSLYLFGSLLLIVILILRIRTIWVLSFIGILLVTRRYFIKTLGVWFIVGLILFFMITFLIAYKGNLIVVYKEKMITAAEMALNPETSTVSWRFENILAYLGSMSKENYLVGTPFGTPVYFSFLGITWNAGLHNQFMEVLYYSGIPGLIFFQLFQLFLLIKLYQLSKREQSKSKKSFIIILFYSLILYQIGFLSWTIDGLYAIILGLTLSLVSNFLPQKQAVIVKRLPAEKETIAV